MRKITESGRLYLSLISEMGGSYAPGEDNDPGSISILDDLVKAKRLRVEMSDMPRYHLTALGREEVG